MVIFLLLYFLFNNMLTLGYTFKFIYGSSWFNIQLSLMSLFSLVLILLYETNPTLVGMSLLLVMFSYLFFLSQSMLMMYLAFELVSMPVVLMMYKEGSQPEKLLAINYMLVYTGFTSAAFMYIVAVVNLDMMLSGLTRCMLICMFLAKSPLFLLHSWLPKAHVEAPTAASMLLAGVLLKVGLYGLIKMLVYMKTGLLWVGYLSVMGLCLSPLSALLSVDSKQFMAYSSISHMNLLVHGLGFFGLYFSSGSYLVCLSHGYISSMLFLMVGEMYQKSMVRLMYYVSGMQFTSGFTLLLHSIVLLGNAGVPPALSFWGELMVVLSLMGSEFWLITLISMYFLFSFYYSIYMLVHVMSKSPSSVYFGVAGGIPTGLSVVALISFTLFPL